MPDPTCRSSVGGIRELSNGVRVYVIQSQNDLSAPAIERADVVLDARRHDVQRELAELARMTRPA